MQVRRVVFSTLIAITGFLVVPVAASGSPELTYPTGTTAVVGVLGTNVGETRMTGSFDVKCSTTRLTGSIATNTGMTQFALNISSASFTGSGAGGKCTSGLGDTNVTVPSLPWCLWSEPGDNFELRGGECTETSRVVTFTLDAAGLECTYQKASVHGSFTTHPEDAKFTISENELPKEAGSFLCPSSVKLDMTFTLEADVNGGGPIYIS